MSHSWALFEANLRKELGRGEDEDDKLANEAPSAVSLLKKNDLFLFGSGSVSNLLVVSCHMCGALLKPAFLSHHITKVHGGVKTEGCSSGSVSSSVSTSRHSTPPSKLFKHPPRPKIIEQIIREEEGFTKSAKSKTQNKSATSGVVKSSKKPPKKGGSKKKQPKNKAPQKPRAEEKESDTNIMRSITFSAASPPPSPPTLYPSPPRLTKATKRKTVVVTEVKTVEPKEVIATKPVTFDFKTLLSQLPSVNPNAYIQRIPTEVTREHRKGLMYQNQRVRPLGECRFGARSFGAGQLVFTRRSDNLRAAIDALLPSQETFKCTSEIKSTQEDVTSETATSTTLDYQSDSQQCTRNQRLDDYCDSFSSSHPTSPDKLLDLFDPDILEKSDEFLTDTYSWPGDPTDKLSNKLFALPPGSLNKPNIPKLKVDTNQIKTNSAMAVFEFDDPEEGRRAKEEERLRALRTGGNSSVGPRKNKRKIVKSPSQNLTPKSNGLTDQTSPPSSSFSKRGRYEVIELDKSPSPPSSSPIKHCVASPRQFSYMMGYGEQSAT